MAPGGTWLEELPNAYELGAQASFGLIGTRFLVERHHETGRERHASRPRGH